jgi:HemY protein
MAEIEQREGANTAAARDWLARVSEADPEPAWLCRACGASAREWSALCGHCGDFDSLAWGQAPRVAALVQAPSGTVLATEKAGAEKAGAEMAGAERAAAQAPTPAGGAPAMPPTAASPMPLAQLTGPNAAARSPQPKALSPP